jgi:tetratricopeptide (TPR) repeat protein
MKDPLQIALKAREKDPYEILEVSEIATIEEINRAFKNCVGSGRNVRDATWARNILINPTDRAFYDLFRYNEDFVKNLRPILKDNESLLKERKRFAEGWSKIQKKLFPDIFSTHSLAVLWYWWTLYREEELWSSINREPFNKMQVSPFSESSEEPFQFKKFGQILAEVYSIDELACTIDRLKRENPGCVESHLREGDIQEWLANVLGEAELAFILDKIYDPDAAYNKIMAYILKKFWEKTISNWVFLINSEDFLKRWIEQKSRIYNISSNSIEGIQQRLKDHFISKFHNFRERYQNIGDSLSAQRYKEYDDLFSIEMRVAQLMVEEEIRVSKKETRVPKNGNSIVISCGPIMLKQIEMLTEVQAQVEKALNTYPESKNLKELLELISPYSSLITLLKNGRFDEVIQTIKKLPKSEQKKKEILKILARAYLEKGKQHFNSKQYEEAFECWKEALKTKEIQQEIKQEIVSYCKKEISSQRSDLDLAIKLLKEAINLTQDEELKLILAEMLNIKGVELINKALERIKPGKGATPEIIKQLEEGISYLNEAVKLGSVKASENLKKAEIILEQVKSGIVGIPPEVADLINKANKAAEESDWEVAVKYLRKALSKAQGDEKEDIKMLVAQCLNNYAVKIIETINPKIEEAIKTAGDPYKILSILKKLHKEHTKTFLEKSYIRRIYQLTSYWWVFLVCGAFFYLLSPKESVVLLIIGMIFLSLRGLLWLLNKLDEIIKETKMISMQNPPYCEICGFGAEYALRLSPYGYEKTIYLCSTHVEQFRSMMKPKLDPTTMNLLKSAKSYLEEASELDRTSEVIQKNLQAVKDIMAKFDI